MKSQEEIQTMIDVMKRDVEDRKQRHTSQPTWAYMSSDYKLDDLIPIDVIEIKIKLLEAILED